jgi:hypothetical protein
MTNPLKEFFLFCSGATRAILKRKECEIEHVKYTGIGATIFFTAVLAAISGGYAMYTALHRFNLSIAFGILWGLIIFNLDRFIVSSIRKPNKNSNASKRVWGGELRKAAPRLLLAVFISVVITKPLELRMFASEIDAQITKDLTDERTRLEQRMKTEFGDIETLESETDSLRLRDVELQNEVIRRTHTATGELDGWSGTRNPGNGKEYNRRLAEAKQAEQELASFREQYGPVIKINDAQIAERKKKRDEAIEQAKQNIDAMRYGLLKRLEALSALTTLDHLPLFLANLFIVLLFISVETAPILVKVFAGRGPYDDYFDAAEHEVYAATQEKLSQMNDDINTRVMLSKQRNAAQVQLDQQTMASLPNLAQNVFDMQVEVANSIVRDWRNTQLMTETKPAPAAALVQTASGNGTSAHAGHAPSTPVVNHAPVTTQTGSTSAGPTAAPIPAQPPSSSAAQTVT